MTSRGTGGKIDTYLASLAEKEKKNLTPTKTGMLCELWSSDDDDDKVSLGNESDVYHESGESDMDNTSDSGDDDAADGDSVWRGGEEGVKCKCTQRKMANWNTC